MRSFGLLLTLTAALLLALTACGGGDDDDDTTGGDDDTGTPLPLTENDLAESMLIALGDLPELEAWQYEAPDESEGPNPFDVCDTSNDPGLIGKADGGNFARYNNTSISEAIRIFNDTDSLEASLQAIEDRGDCMGQVVADGGLDSNDVSFTDFTQEVIDYTEFGDDSEALRIEMMANDLTGQEDPVQVYIDQVYVAIDDVGMRIQASNIGNPYAENEVAAFVQLAEQKVRDVIASE